MPTNKTKNKINEMKTNNERRRKQQQQNNGSKINGTQWKQSTTIYTIELYVDIEMNLWQTGWKRDIT